METIRGVETVKLFEKSRQRHGAWMSLFVDTVNANLTAQKLSILFGFANKLLFGIEGIVIVYFGASGVLDGLFTVGALMAFLAYKGQFESRVGVLVDQYVQIKMLGLHAERLADIVLTETEAEKVKEHHIPEAENTVIEIEQVSFRYSDNEPLSNCPL